MKIELPDLSWMKTDAADVQARAADATSAVLVETIHDLVVKATQARVRYYLSSSQTTEKIHELRLASAVADEVLTTTVSVLALYVATGADPVQYLGYAQTIETETWRVAILRAATAAMEELRPTVRARLAAKAPGGAA